MGRTDMQRTMKRREVIALTIGGKTVYYAKRGQWDASWYTSDINRAKVWRHPGIASETIRVGYGESWKDFNPRVLDPRTVDGYVDIPSAAEKRHAQKNARVRELFTRVSKKRDR